MNNEAYLSLMRKVPRMSRDLVAILSIIMDGYRVQLLLLLLFFEYL